MDLDKEKLLKNLLKNKRIYDRVNKLKVPKKQLFNALPILIDMNEEKEDDQRETLTSFDLVDGSVKRISILSNFGKKNSFLDNIITQKINFIDFEMDKKFFPEENRKKLVDSFTKLIEKPFGNQKGFYIYGKTGIGKTFLMKRFAKKLAQKNKKVGFINISNLVSTLKSYFNKENGYEHIILMLKKVEYLFIDDIGSENITSWFRDEILFSILNDRMEKRNITFFASNFSINNLENVEAKTSNQKFLDKNKSERLITRIKALSNEIHLIGSNKRY